MDVVDQKLRSIGWIHERTGLGARQYCKGSDHERSPRILFYFDALLPAVFNLVSERHCESIEVIAEAEDLSTFEVIAFLGEWACGNFLEYAARDWQALNLPYLDVIIGNPPFSLGCEFLAASANIIRESGRILFLLPTEYFQAQGRAEAFAKTGLVISAQWQVAGRVGFLRDGKEYRGRQCGDSVFEFSHSSWKPAAIQIVDPYGRLAS